MNGKLTVLPFLYNVVYYALLLSSLLYIYSLFFCIIQNNLYFSIKELLNIFTAACFIAGLSPRVVG